GLACRRRARERPRGRPVPGRPRPAPRLVPFLAAHGLRDVRARALPWPADPRLHGGQPGPQDEQVHGQRGRSAGDQQEAGRRDHPPVGGGLGLLRRHRRRRQDPGPGGGRLPPHPQHAALPAGQRERLRPGQGRGAAGRDAGDRPLRHEPRGTVPGRGAGALRGLRVPPGGGQAAGVLLGGPGRLLPGHPEGPALHHRREVARAPQRADGTVEHHPRHAALDGALPQLHRRGGLEGVRHVGVDLPGGVRRAGRARSAAAGQVVAHPRDPRRGQQGDRGPPRRGPGRLLAAGQPGGERRRRRPRIAGQPGRRPEVCVHHLGRRAGGRRGAGRAGHALHRHQVRALLALARRPRPRPCAPRAVRPLHHQPVRSRRRPEARL
ncbi:MAG: Isoleucyl-tRNA synthetase, partial [uncultured Ramlibacter sp.]